MVAVWILDIYKLIDHGISERINYVELLNVEVKIGRNGHQSPEYPYYQYSSVCILELGDL
jgi:hypothetical protein